jgi:D-apionolactonase
MKLSKNVQYYGKDELLPKQIDLQAGPLNLFYEAGDLRYIKFGDKEIIRRVYVAVRDHNWDTVIPVLSNVRMNIANDSFYIKYSVSNIQDNVDFLWEGNIIGKPNGTITFSMDGVAQSTFWRNRIGFCILYPMEYAGVDCEIEHVSGAFEKSSFPKFIAPQRIIDGKPSPVEPFSNMRALVYQVVPNVLAEVRFEGENFEMEDQRNWTDASFKAYGTPLKSPSPVEVKTGTKISQTFTLSIRGQDKILKPSKTDDTLTFSIGKNALRNLPKIGLDEASHGQPLNEKEIERLKTLNLSHQRLSLYLSNPDYEKKLRQSSKEANKLGINLETALFLSNEAESELKVFVELLKQIKPPIVNWLIFHKEEMTTSEKWIILAQKFLKDYDHNSNVGSGTNVFFADLNRSIPPFKVMDFITYSINPQVHAFDNLSLVETLSAQGETVKSARNFSNNKPISVSPITLKMRFNPNATAPEANIESNQLPSQVDVRQMSLFGAAWTLGSLKNLSESETRSLTYYETTGWRGVMEVEFGSHVPEKFHSLKGAVFPIYHVFADVGEFADGQIVSTSSSNPLKITGLALKKKGRTRIIIANLSSEVQQLTVQNLSSSVKIRHLNENNIEQAMQSPEVYRSQNFQKQLTINGSVKFELLPYALLCIDSND